MLQIKLLHAAVAESDVKKEKINWQIIAEHISPNGVKDVDCYLKYMQLRQAHEQSMHRDVKEETPLIKVGNNRWSPKEVRRIISILLLDSNTDDWCVCNKEKIDCFTVPSSLPFPPHCLSILLCLLCTHAWHTWLSQDERLVQAVGRCGGGPGHAGFSWSRVGALLPARGADSCRRRWGGHLQPAALGEDAPWSLHEVGGCE
jgi:hypothetical protein